MPEGHPLQPGDPERLGAYRLVGRLGEGSQGVVYLGRDEAGTPVAIKLLHARMAGRPRARERFVRELSAAKKVARFCTAQVLDADVAGDRPYIVSEYVQGRSLRSQILDEGPRTGGALERLAIGTLTALAAIHRAGVIHRDFTPHNVLLGTDGPRVIDFGIARALDGAMHNESNSVGTPAYMAPEQVSGDEIGPPADMFAWGGTILFAATGRPPFGNESVRAVMDRVLRADADVTPLPEPLRSVVARCLAKDPAARPTAQQAQAALLGQEPVGPLGPPPAFGAAGAPGGPPGPLEKEPGATARPGSTERAWAAAFPLPPAGPDAGSPWGAGTPSHGRPPGSGPDGTAPAAATAGHPAGDTGDGPDAGGTSPRPSRPAGPAAPFAPAGPGGAAASGPEGTGGAGATGPHGAAATAGVSALAPRIAGRLPVRWAVAAGAVATVVVTGVALAVWPDGGDAATSPRVPAAAATPPPVSPSPSGAGRARAKMVRVSPTPRKRAKKGPAPGCRGYSRRYAIANAGRVVLTTTVCRGVYSGTATLADTDPKDGWQVCAQLRGHVAGTADVFISTPVLASKAGATQGFNNGPDLRFGAKAHKREDWVQVNAGRCRPSHGGLRTAWVTHDHLAAG